MARLYRAQVLLEQEQHLRLAKIAKREERSISLLLREIVQTYLEERDQGLRAGREMDAIQALHRIRDELRRAHGEFPVGLLDQVREEREQDTERVWRGEP